MFPREVRTRIAAAILRLDRFTVKELCAEARLHPQKVYPVLAKLKQEGYLRASPILPPDGTKRLPQRPANNYFLSEEVSKRRELAAEVSAFTIATQEPSPDDTEEAFDLMADYIAADSLLDRTAALVQAMGHPPHPFGAEDTLVTQADHLIREADNTITKLLERSSAGLIHRRLVEDLARLEQIRERVDEHRDRISARVMGMDAQAQFGELLMRVHRLGTPKSLADALLSTYSSTSNTQLKFTLSAVLDNVNACNNWLKRTRNRQARLFGASSGKQCLNRILTESAIRYSDAPSLLLTLSRRVSKSSPDDEKASYNLINLESLAGNNQRAFRLWERWAQASLGPDSDRFANAIALPPTYLSCAPYLLLWTSLTKTLIDSLEERCGENASFSVVSMRRFRFLGANPYVTEGLLFDPMETKPFVRVAECYDAIQPALYAYGPLVDRVKIPGIPAVRLANGLVRMGIDSKNAWDLSHSLSFDNTLVVIHSNSDELSALKQRVEPVLLPTLNLVDAAR